MNSLRILAPCLAAFAIVSCASSQKGGQYDTPGATAATTAAPAGGAPGNSIYDTPAAYEDSATNAAGAAGPNATAGTTPIAPYNPEPSATATPTRPAAAAAAGVAVPRVPKAPTAAAAPASTNGAAIIHTVVAGDTLSGIASKYKVPSAAIKQANGMTSDVVVLGRKMVIPPAH